MPPETSDRDAALLLDVLLAARDALGFVTAMDLPAFHASRLHRNAVIRSLEVLGEAAGQVSPGCRAANPDLPWRQMIALRNRLIHGYADVRAEVVWNVVQDHLPGLVAALTGLVPRDDPPSA